jgi:CIC family chloride channel protein
MKRWLDKLQPSESIVMAGASVFIGVASGFGVWGFKRLIDLFHLAAFGYLGGGLDSLSHWLVWLVPVIGGLVVGLLMYFFIGEERHHGVAGIMEATALAGGRLRYQRMPIKAVAAALSIGSGASVGPEDPSVQIGANIGSFLGQNLHLSDDRTRSLVAAGAASGIAAAFNAPIAGIFFALEIIMGEIGGSTLGIVVLASVSSAVLTQMLSGPEPAFHVPTYAFGSVWEMPLYLALGLLAGPASALYIRVLYLAQDIFHRMVKIPRWGKPLIAGAVIGIVGLFLPQAMGVGYDTIGQALNGESLGVLLLLALLVAKLILTPVSIGGGFPGGVFAPSLFIGAMLGGAFGWIVNGILPGLNIVPPAFAMVGMAAVLAGAVHAPLTAILLLFEMTNDYRIILPLMFAVVVSLVISQQLQKESVYTLSLARKGIQLDRGRDVEVLETMTVGDVMQPAPIQLSDTETVAEAHDRLTRTHHHGAPVFHEEDQLVGILTLQDIDRIPIEQWATKKVGDICTHELMVAYPEETIGKALHQMNFRDVGRLPVIDRNQPTKLVGWLRRADMLHAYDIALEHRAAMRHRAHSVMLGTTTDRHIRVAEIMIEAGSPCAGKHIKEISWPRDCIVSSLRIGKTIIIPHGNTILRPGNVLVAVVEGGAEDEVKCLCQAQPKSKPETELTTE